MRHIFRIKDVRYVAQMRDTPKGHNHHPIPRPIARGVEFVDAGVIGILVVTVVVGCKIEDGACEEEIAVELGGKVIVWSWYSIGGP